MRDIGQNVKLMIVAVVLGLMLGIATATAPR